MAVEELGDQRRESGGGQLERDHPVWYARRLGGRKRFGEALELWDGMRVPVVSDQEDLRLDMIVDIALDLVNRGGPRRP